MKKKILLLIGVCAGPFLFSACAFNFDMKGDFASLGYKRAGKSQQEDKPAIPQTGEQDKEEKK